ncbi:MAG TPA: hypothetical protein VGK32_17170 [Vicinamibacterales bacterium]
MPHADKPLARLLARLHGEIKTPPLSSEARIEAGLLLRTLQREERPGMPQSRPMPVVGVLCHEAHIPDGDLTRRIIYRLDSDAVVGIRLTKPVRPMSLFRVLLARTDDPSQESVDWRDSGTQRGNARPNVRVGEEFSGAGCGNAGLAESTRGPMRAEKPRRESK